MLSITKNFSLEELCRTDTKLDNTPDLNHIVSLCYGVCMILQPLRDYLGQPIIINSGFRSKAVNKKVGGVYNSQHMLGQAVDIKVNNEIRSKVWDFLSKCKYVDQCLGADTFIHVSWSPCGTPRQYYKFNYYK